MAGRRLARLPARVRDRINFQRCPDQNWGEKRAITLELVGGSLKVLNCWTFVLSADIKGDITREVHGRQPPLQHKGDECQHKQGHDHVRPSKWTSEPHLQSFRAPTKRSISAA